MASGREQFFVASTARELCAALSGIVGERACCSLCRIMAAGICIINQEMKVPVMILLFDLRELLCKRPVPVFRHCAVITGCQ